MMSKRRRFGAAVALAMAALTVGCESGSLSKVTSPSVGPSASSAGIHMVRAAAPTQRTTVVRMIGSDGGTIELSGHKLTVPAGAVSAPTLFTISTSGDQYVRVDLHAARRNAHGSDDDVGSRGFARTVQLDISYASVADAVDPREFAIVWVRDDGTLVRLPSMVNTAARTVHADLEHFSGYALATGRQ